MLWFTPVTPYRNLVHLWTLKVCSTLLRNLCFFLELWLFTGCKNQTDYHQWSLLHICVLCFEGTECWSQIIWNWNHLRSWGCKHYTFFLHTTQNNLFSLHNVSCPFWTGYRKEYTWTETKVIWTEGQEGWKDQWCCCLPFVILSVLGYTSAYIGWRAICLKGVNSEMETNGNYMILKWQRWSHLTQCFLFCWCFETDKTFWTSVPT